MVVAVGGEIDCFTGPVLEQRLADLIEAQGNLSVVLDLRDVAFIDSSGLSALVTAHRSLQSRGGQLKVAGATERTRKVLELTGLHRVLTLR